MPDPIDELENFSDPGLAMNPLPASEVRRRGTRMRRRNNALAAVGGVAAVAIIATPLAMAATNKSTDTTPPVTNPSPSVTWVQEIPADFPLTDRHAPRNDSTRRLRAPADADACAGLGWSPDGPPAAVDLQRVYQTENEGGCRAHARALRRRGRRRGSRCWTSGPACRSAPPAPTGEARSTEVPSSSDASSLVYVDHISDGRRHVRRIQVVRVGNALLLDTVLLIGSGDPQHDPAERRPARGEVGPGRRRHVARVSRDADSC